MVDSIISKLPFLQGYQPKRIPTGNRRQAAVLIPLLQDENHQLVYTERSLQLKKHPGQISFPGGKIEPGEDPWQAALREAQEEVGINPENVEPLGEVDEAYSPRGFHIRCFVGRLNGFNPEINPDEVSRLVEVDLGELFNEGLHELKPWNNRPGVHYFSFRNGQVWGVTGYITWRLREILKIL